VSTATQTCEPTHHPRGYIMRKRKKTPDTEIIHIAFAPTLLAFQSSVLYQHATAWLDLNEEKLYSLVIKSVTDWNPESITFEAALRLMPGFAVGWHSEHTAMWDFYKKMDELTAFKGEFYPGTLTGKLYIDRSFLKKLEGAAGNESPVLALLKTNPLPAHMAKTAKDELDVFLQNAAIIQDLPEVAHSVETRRLDEILAIYGLAAPE